MSELRSLVRSIPDYPKKGIIFRDITTLLGDAQGFRKAIDGLAAPYLEQKIDAVAGIEWRPPHDIPDGEIAFPSMRVALRALLEERV